MGMKGDLVYAGVCAEALPNLFTLINAPDSRSPENNTATENAISAVTKIFKYNKSCIKDLDQVKKKLFVCKRKLFSFFTIASTTLVYLASDS